MSLKYHFKYIRDPLYGFIGISKKEDAVINTPIFQRLRRIKQLSNSFLIYPGTVHSRLEHSLGVLYLSGIIADKLKLKKDKKKILRLMALVHDIGQGPFSHVFEIPMKWINGVDYGHEDATIFLLKNDEDLGKALGKEKDAIIDIFEDKQHLLHKIISSEFDVDRLDYLRRDSYHAGVSYGVYDLERILLTICKISRFGEDYFGVTEKGMRAIESYRLARFNLTDQVYEHHARLASDDFLCKAIRLAIDEGCINENSLKLTNKNAKLFCDYFCYLDDYSLQHEIICKSKGRAKELITSLRNRKLPKRAYRIRADMVGIPDPILLDKILRMDSDEIEEKERQISEGSGIPLDYLMLHLQDTPIKGYRTITDDLGVSGQILIEMQNGDVLSLDQVSPLILQLSSIRRLYVFGLCKKMGLKKIQQVTEEEFNIKSDYLL